MVCWVLVWWVDLRWCDCGFRGLQMGVAWVSGGSQVRFHGLQMGVAVGLRCIWNGSQRLHSG